MRLCSVSSTSPILTTSQTTPEAVVSLMVGRELTAIFGERHDQPRRVEPVLSLRGVAAGPRVKDISFDLYAGEVLGLAGLVGAGRSEVARAVFGVDRRSAGDVLLDGSPTRWRGPRDAIAAGIGFVPEDRRQQGL